LLLQLGQGSNFMYLATTIDQLEAAEKPQAGDLPGKLLRLARPLEDESIGQLLDCVRIRRSGLIPDGLIAAIRAHAPDDSRFGPSFTLLVAGERTGE